MNRREQKDLFSQGRKLLIFLESLQVVLRSKTRPQRLSLLPLGKIVEIIEIVILGGKNRMTIVPPLDDVVRVAGNDDTSGSGHGRTLAKAKN